METQLSKEAKAAELAIVVALAPIIDEHGREPVREVLLHIAENLKPIEED